MELLLAPLGARTQDCTLQAGSHVIQQSEGMLKKVKSAVDVPNQPNEKLKLAQVRQCS